MADTSSKPAHIPLRVLETNRKVEEFRRDIAENPITPRQVDRAPVDTRKSPELNALEEKVIAALQTVYDPEIPVSIYELGLIYEIDVTPEQTVNIKMTLTAPACPVAGAIVADVQRKVSAVPGVASASVDLVWEPSWTKDRMSEAALLDLGLL